MRKLTVTVMATMVNKHFKRIDQFDRVMSNRIKCRRQSNPPQCGVFRAGNGWSSGRFNVVSFLLFARLTVLFGSRQSIFSAWLWQIYKSHTATFSSDAREYGRERERESDTYHISRVLVARKGFSARLELAAGSVLPVGYRSVLVSEMLPNSAAPTG